MNKYAQLDGDIVAAIRAGRNTFIRLQSPEIMSQCKVLAGLGDDWRVLDRRLQALRKAGRIQYKGHWQEVQPSCGGEGDAVIQGEGNERAGKHNG